VGNAGSYFLKQFDSFGGQQWLKKIRESSYVAARTREALNEAAAYRI